MSNISLTTTHVVLSINHSHCPGDACRHGDAQACYLMAAERVFGAVFGVPGVFGSGLTVVFGSSATDILFVQRSAERVFVCSANF